jgi:Rv2525c-like, glycoside hydrolase-like domain
MRRAIAAAVTSGLVLGGAMATPALAVAHSGAKDGSKAAARAPAKTAKTAARPAAKPASKTVVYDGYEFQVPAGWPVYRLDQHPRTCVRYDVNAVYLGTPGANMDCPAGLVGRAQTVSFIPGHGRVAVAGAGSVIQPAGPGAEVQRLSAVGSAMTDNTEQRQLRVVLGSAGAGGTVTGTYGSDPAEVRKVLATLRKAPSGSKDSVQSAPAAQSAGSSATGRAALSAPRRATAPAPAAPAPTATYTSWKGVPKHWPIEIIAPKPTPKPAAKPVGGFDSCTAPSLAAMSAYRSHYAAAGVYIGGANTGCGYGNLSKGWIASAAAMGYGMLPTYVGPQAPCWGFNGQLINPASAAAQGTAAGADAVTDAQYFGLPKGSPVYYDMEAYRGSTSCTTAVLAFLGAWDRRVVAGGYVTGVYSSQDSGIADMQAAALAKTAGFTPPQAVWIALWDNQATLQDGTLAWPTAARDKQYAGNVNVSIGGYPLNIDKDYVGGPVAR